ncbi:hypothetical protein ACFL96_08640 [Thermoproteota archaeon]
MSIFQFLQIFIVIISTANGLLCSINPAKTIKMQQGFYEKINWRIEPIDLEKEIRNTRTMGFISLIIAVGLVINLLINT